MQGFLRTSILPPGLVAGTLRISPGCSLPETKNAAYDPSEPGFASRALARLHTQQMYCATQPPLVLVVFLIILRSGENHRIIGAWCSNKLLCMWTYHIYRAGRVAALLACRSGAAGHLSFPFQSIYWGTAFCKSFLKRISILF